MTLLYLVQREWSAQLRSVKFFVLSATAFILAVLAVNVGARDIRLQQDEAQQLETQRTADRTTTPRLTGWNVEPGLRAVRFPSRLGAFVRGLEHAIPIYWDFSPAGTRSQSSRALVDLDAGLRAPLDLTFIVRVVLGLLALIIGLDVLAGERDSGTLRALLSQPISPQLVFVSKAVASLLTLSCSVSMLVIGAFVASTFWLPDLGIGGALGFFLSFGALSVLYLFALFACGLLVGAVVRHERVAQTIAIVAWVYLALVAPQLVSFARDLFPAAPAHVFEARRQAAWDAETQKTQELLGNALPMHDGRIAELDDATRARLESIWQQRAAVARNEIGELEEAGVADVRRQRRAVAVATAFSPAAQFVDGAAQLAGTGRQSRDAWEASVAGYESTLNHALFDDQPRPVMLVPQPQGKERVSFRRKEPPLITAVPVFSPPSDTARQRIHASLPSAAWLSLYALVFLGGAFAAFSRRTI